MPEGATFNAEEQAKYRAFKEARSGAADYMAMEGEFKRYLDDVYSEPPIPREALNDECEILVVGAGFGRLLKWQRLREAGLPTYAFEIRAAMSAEPGTGIAIPGLPVTSNPTATCPCSKRPTTSRR
jgi:hypothetical protein